MFTPGSRACGYRTASGRAKWPSRDPIEEAGGLNLYGFVKDSPVDVIDPLGQDEYKVVCSRRDELSSLVSGIETKNPSDLRLTFLRAQLCILDKLCMGSCCTGGDRTGWLNRVIDKFMGNLLDATRGDLYDDNRIWSSVFSIISARQLQLSVFESTSDPLLRRNLSQLRQKAVYDVAEMMVLTHINNDLWQALERHGIGRNNDWNCIGKVVRDCSATQFNSLELKLATLLGKDAETIRDEMRFRVSLKNPLPIRTPNQ